MNQDSLTAKLDKLAVGLSAGCLVHCLISPVLVVIAPIIGGFFAGEGFHALLLVLILPTSFVALFLGCRKHGRRAILILGIVAMGIMTGAVLSHEIIGDVWERTLTGLGGLLLATGHVMNYRSCRHAHCDN